MKPYKRLVRRSVSLCALCLLLLPARGYGLDPSRRISQYGHTVWRTEDGVVNATSPMTQTTDGYIWVTTQNGLARFDGVSFVSWTPPPRHSVPIAAPHHTAGRPRRKPMDRYFERSRSLERWAFPQLFKTGRKMGDLLRYRRPFWARLGHALPPLYGGRSNLRDTQGLHCYGQSDGVPLRYGLGLAEDSQGNFWIGSEYLCRWKPGSTCESYFKPAVDDIEVVAAGPSQAVWAVASRPGRVGGLQVFSAGKWTPYSAPGFDGSTVGVQVILTDRDGSLWVGTEKQGLYRIYNETVDHYGPADGLSGHQVADLFEDREGNLWVTTDGGMDMFRFAGAV